MLEITTVIFISDCPEPTKPLHGSISFTGTDVGATAEQSCDTGYSMTGVSVITCLENELWSHGPVTCTPIGKILRN